jgi:hypothetical protein
VAASCNHTPTDVVGLDESGYTIADTVAAMRSIGPVDEMLWVSGTGADPCGKCNCDAGHGNCHGPPQVGDVLNAAERIACNGQCDSSCGGKCGDVVATATTARMPRGGVHGCNGECQSNCRGKCSDDMMAAAVTARPDCDGNGDGDGGGNTKCIQCSSST